VYPSTKRKNFPLRATGPDQRPRALGADEQLQLPEPDPGVHRLLAGVGNLPSSSASAIRALEEAEPLMRRALAIDEKSYGPGHPDVAIDLNNLAALLQTTNRLGEAEPLMRRALAIDKKSYGPEHPNVASELKQPGAIVAGHEPAGGGRSP
jgi:tetratricopeptide (TPR) repeat protein